MGSCFWKKAAAPALTVAMVLLLGTVPAKCEVVRGGATLSGVSSVVKISREGNGIESLLEGEVLYIFTETGEVVAQIVVKDVFSDEIHSEPLPSAVARQIRDAGVILVFSNLREYGDYIRATLTGTAEAFRGFIADHPRSELREEVQRILDGLVYRPYKLRGTVQAFEEFLEKFPGNFYAANAKKRRDDLQYAVARELGRISAYRKFLLSWPDNIHAAEAREHIARLQEVYEEVSLADLATYPRSKNGKTVKFTCSLHSVLPIYVEGPGVGRKGAAFKSPRSSNEHANLQVEDEGMVLWRVFADREDEQLVRTITSLEKGTPLRIYGKVFDITGGAPWIDVDDVEKL